MKKNTKSTLLKSVVTTTLSIASISPIAIALGKQIADEQQNKLLNNISKQIQSWDNIQNMNVATNNMFQNTENISSLSSLGRGQMVTPYGWLGTYSTRTAINPGANQNSDSAKDFNNNTLVLVGWDGSIIWTNNDSPIAIYSAKYDFKNDVIFVTRTQDPSGAGGHDANLQPTTDPNESYKVALTIHDAKTGKILYDGQKQQSLWNFKGLFDDNRFHWDQYNKRDLYYQDMVTFSNGDILWLWTPNYNKLRNDATTLSEYIQLMTGSKSGVNNNADINKNYYKALIIKKSDIDDVRAGKTNAKITPIDWVGKHLGQNAIFYSVWIGYPLIFPPTFFVEGDSLYSIDYCVNTADSTIYRSTAQWTYDPNNNDISYTRTAWWVVYFDAVDRTNFSMLKKNDWDSQLYNENSLLLPTRNIFDQNVVTIPYPAYANIDPTKNLKLPIFNVLQAHGKTYPHNSLLDIKVTGPKYKEFNFGDKIYRHYKNNNLSTIDPTTVNNSSPLLWYPWPGAISTTTGHAYLFDAYSNQLYSRLISVSPFDNTIVYASRPNVYSQSSISGDDYAGVSSGNNPKYYGSFWIGNSSDGKISNFILSNSNLSQFGRSILSANIVANPSNAAIDTLYKTGFWFDINSNSNSSNNNKVNLYFLSTGNWKNYHIPSTDNSVKSTAIVLMNPSTTTKFDMNNVTSTKSTEKNFVKLSTENDNNIVNFVTSRADLNLWFNRTYQNLTRGANAYQNNTLLNDYDINNQNRAVATQFNTKLNTAGFFGPNNKSVELFSLWKTGSESYSALPVKRAKIVTKIDTNQVATNALNVELQFILANINTLNNQFIETTDKDKVTTFTYPVTISNASWQLMDSWSTNVKLETFSQNPDTNEFNTSLKIVGDTNPTQGKYGTNFGTHNLGYWTRVGNNGNYNYTWNGVNGNILNNNTDTPLWVEFGIDYDPNKNANADWKHSLESYENGLFKKTYPAGSSLPAGATSFNEVLDKFIKWKAANLMYENSTSNPTNNIYSPGQICIKAYLKINPHFTKNSSNTTLYSMPLDGGVEVQVLYDSTNDIRYVYRDEYKGNRVVYKQTSSEWDQNKQYGFGSSVTSDITNSWISIPGNNQIFTAYLNNGITIKDTLVRDTNTKTDQMFSAKYSTDGNSIILTIKNGYVDWVKQRFSSYNQMVGRYIKFQYLSVNQDNVSQSWKDFNSEVITDATAKTMFDNNNSYTIKFTPTTDVPTLPNNLQKVRFALYSLPTNDSNYNPNKIVASNNLSGNAEFLSDAITLDQVPLHVDYTWLKDVELTTNQNDKFLNGPGNKQIDKAMLITALDSFQTTVINKSTNINNFKNLLKLTYSLDNNQFVDASGLYDLLKTKWETYSDPNLGIISLYDNRNSNTSIPTTKIYVKFALKDTTNADKYDIVEQNKDQNFVNRTNIKYFINLSQYTNVLETTKTSVERGTTENSIKNFTPPAMTGNPGSGFLNGKTFDDITKVLAKFGITVEYKKSDNSWTSNKSDITSYDPNTREIKMRFVTNANSNINVVASIDGTNTFNPSSNEISLKLNVPILVDLQEGVKNNFISKNHINGNTWKINIDANSDKSIINDIKTDGKGSANSTDQPIWDTLDQYLEVQYALSNTNPTNNTTFYNRQDLINNLQNATQTNYNNTIWARLHLKTVQGQDSKFVLTNNALNPFKMNNEQSNPNRNKILIYVQSQEYENELNNISISGSTGNLIYSYPEAIQKIINDVNLGVKIQYSLKQDITYNDTTATTDISKGWVDTSPTSVPVGTPSIKVRIIVTDSNKYIYGKGNDNSADPKVHSIDLNNISSLIDVDSNWFNQESLTVATAGNYLKDINATDVTSWKDKILNKSNALKADTSLKNKVEIKFQIEGYNNWYDATGLVTQLKSMINDNSGSNLGIIYLWDGTRGIKIKAKFEKKTEADKVVFVDTIPGSTTPNTNLENQVKTDQIKTYVDLSSYVTVLTSNKTTVVLQNGKPGTIQSFTPPAMTGNVGNGFLSGKTFDEIANRLKVLGITFTFNDGIGGNPWITKDKVTSYNTVNPILDLGFKYDGTKAPNITFKINQSKEISTTTEESNLIRLQLLAPITIQVDLTKLLDLKFEGDTKHISNANNITTKTQEIITNIKNNLTASNIDHTDLNLEIRFSLNKIKLEENITETDKSDDGIWFTFDKLNSILSSSTTNYNTNAIYAKYYIKNNPKIENVDKYLLSDTNSENINQENLTSTSNFKVYINNTEQTKDPWITNNLKLQGSQDNFTITNLNSWIQSLPAGLEVEYNATADSTKQQPDPNSWKKTYKEASPIDSLRNYWIRFKVKDAYTFEGASNNTQYSQAFKLDASQIQVALKLQSEWLNQITLTGNLKELTIDENQAIQQVTDANMMPVNNIIRIEYSFDDIHWYYKDTFIANLKTADGAKDSTNWIILREDIKARFSLDPNVNNTEPKYLLEVDGTNINEDNSNNISKQLITDKQNTSVKGYINLNKFTPYKGTNFSVLGTDTDANLNIKKYNDLNNLLVPYSSKNLFSILYKWEQTATYDANNKVWTPGQDLTSSMPLQGNYSARYFAMQFQIDNQDYELYKDGNKQANNNYEFATDKTGEDKIDIKISVAIENPLEAQDITIQFLTTSNQAQWYNGEGAFTIQITKPAQGGSGTQTFNTFKDFLDTWAQSMLQDQKEALDLVYYVANEAVLEETEYQNAINKLNEYSSSTEKYNVWKSINDQATANQLNYHLKVNDYVILAVRIKENKLASETNPNGYILKNNKNNPTKATRAFGYKVHTDNIDVDWTTLKVRNVDAAETASYGLDGYAMLDQVSLKRSTNANAATSDDYLNVSLQLNYFTEFHTNSSNEVLVSGDGSRLVKRSTVDSETDGNYKNSDGVDIVDSNGQTVPILYQKGQKDKGILAKPIKASAIQRNHNLVETTTNNYTLELNNGESNALYSFFKFQDIEIQFVNKKGLSDPNDPNVFDYYVDNSNVTKPYIIDTQIKFPIENNRLIRYTFNSEEFISYIKDPNNINTIFENTVTSGKNPINGQSKLKYMYKVTRTEGNNVNSETFDTVSAIMQKIQADFGSKVVLKTTYTPINGSAQIIQNNDLSSISSLSNGDRFRIEIVSSDENNLIFAQQPSPLVFTISGLYEADIDEEYLQYLRVQQNGNYNGEGQFEIFVDNPYDDTDNHIPVSTLLQKYKFMIRVWDSNKKVKQEWTTDYDSIANLSNGDKVEWKLVSPNGAPVEKAYYNTVANMDKHNPNNKVFSFSQVNKIGNANTTVVANVIGQNPLVDEYPENSGFLISGLADKISDTYTTISEEEFIRLMNIINFGYTGINGQGNMISERDINTITVNTSGLTRQEYSFKYLVDQGYLTFFSNDVEFTWNQVKDNNGNWLISPGTLSNGDQIKIKYQDPTMSSAYVWEAPEVYGLKDKSDSMSLLAYVGIGMASFVTLGLFALIYFRARNKKLRK